MIHDSASTGGRCSRGRGCVRRRCRAAAPFIRPHGKAVAAQADDIANARGLTPDDVEAALKTYVPSGKFDEFFIFASAGTPGKCWSSACPRCACSR